MSDHPTPALKVRLVPQVAVRTWPEWPAAFAGDLKDHRYYELVADRLDFDCHVLVVEDGAGRAHALQPCFFAEQDLAVTAAPWLRMIVAWLRRPFPRFLRLRLLMIGCAAGEGRLTAPAYVKDLCHSLPHLARKHGASLIVWKDMPTPDRAAMQAAVPLFRRVASMPATVLPLRFADFEDYLAHRLSHATRKNLRRKFRALGTAPPLAFSATTQVADFVAEVHALYLQVYERSRLQFEKLTPEFLLGLGQRLGDRVQFFLWRQEGRLVAVSICLVHDGVLHDEYLGLDYAVALDLHLYFATFRDVLNWAIARGLRAYVSTPLNYEPKRHLGFHLRPLDLYVTATAAWARPLLRLGLPLLEPTRADPALRGFPSADPA